ncbi:MAG: FAD-dependent oxidoreductase [Lentisphaeria bacterium]|nr:FAD-dependent oxidoreductase [Lentisphaeria bacterium]
MKTLIIGGVAAGAGAAARLRRLDESMEIILLERGSYISYANCGLPYHLGGVIPERDSLLVMPEKKFRAWFNVEIRTRNEAVAIDRARKTVTVRRADGSEYAESYDKLLLATGSRPAAPDLPGADDPRIHPLWTIPDMDALDTLAADGARKALVVGGGFIGLEAAENLHRRGLEVTVIQHSGHVLPSIDREMAWLLGAELAADGIDVRLNAELTGFRKEGGSLRACLKDGTELAADLVVMSVGVKPNSELAGAAGLELGPRGHIVVNEHLQTSDPDIYAAGDAVEVIDCVSGRKTAIPLAGPANKQGRIAAGNIVGKPRVYRGSWGASVIKVGSLTAAAVGLTEARLRQLGLEYHRIYTHPASSASYYPGGAQLHMKLLFGFDGKILGAQVVGVKGADKRLDVIGAAMQSGRTAPELAELELAYAPPFNSAKDPVNFLGMIAQNVLDGTTELAYADSIPADALVIDVREEAEHQAGAIPGAVNIPLGQLRGRLNELDRSRELIVSCQVGSRGYLAERILKQNGFRVRNLSGGYLTWKYMHAEVPAPGRKNAVPQGQVSVAGHTLDVRMLACPGPVVRLKGEMEKLAAGETLRLLAPSSFAPDLEAWARSSGNGLAAVERKDDYLEALLRKGGMAAETAPASLPGHRAAIVLFSNDLDKAMAALIIACGMAASGAKVGIFFTFWGLSVLRRNPAPAVPKNFLSRMFGWMLPKGASKLALSKMNMAGIGTAMMKDVMKRQNVTSLPELLDQARGLGVRFVACEMAMNVMGITRGELIEVDEVAGVASFVGMAKESNNTLFI